MLVLTRQRDELVIIETKSGEIIEVQIVDIRGDKIRIGFTADPNRVTIHRQEVRDRIARENKQCDQAKE